LSEGKGIHPALYSHLKNFFKKNPKGTFKDAQEAVKAKMKDWELSKDDYKEAKKQFA
jgi:hypothetical protein